MTYNAADGAVNSYWVTNDVIHEIKRHVIARLRDAMKIEWLSLFNEGRSRNVRHVRPNGGSTKGGLRGQDNVIVSIGFLYFSLLHNCTTFKKLCITPPYSSISLKPEILYLWNQKRMHDFGMRVLVIHLSPSSSNHSLLVPPVSLTLPLSQLDGLGSTVSSAADPDSGWSQAAKHILVHFNVKITITHFMVGYKIHTHTHTHKL